MLSFLSIVVFVPIFVHSLAPTDEIQDADPAQSGYLSNHNMDPATVGSSSFGILWKNIYGAKELWYAKPLVYTPPGASQLVFTASSMNVIRTLDAVNGTLLSSRTVQPPFLQSDIGCTDIPNYIGVTGTPVIDPTSNTAYFFSKGYKNGASSGGVANGIYQFYAVDVQTLQDKPGFPVLIDGHFADNDNTRYFIGGTVLQRPSLTMLNGVVVGGFGGHCDLFNYTGMAVAVSTSAGVGVTSIYAMEASPGAPPVVTDITLQEGGKAGIWQGGMGLAQDGNRFFLATGNGEGHANGDVPGSGRTSLSTLDEVVASMTVSPAGNITLSDYFEPYEYVSMDAGDRDLGSGGVALLDPTVFNGGGVSRIAVSVGKNGKAYILDANNLGGFKQGSGGTDNIIQTIIAQGSVFAGAGSYPLEGGYIYFTPIGYPTVCYKLGVDLNGAPLFTLVGQTATNGAGRVGIGPPTITTYKGQAGTGILWICDPIAGLVAFNAVPVNGVLTPITIPATGGLNKFLRPAFGDGRLYVSDSNGNIICLGSPVALPLSCTSPVDFGDVAIGTASTQIINCTALIAITSINGCATFSFPITLNLTQASINDAQNASFGKVLPGVSSTNLNLYTTNAVAQYSNVLPISLTGTTVSETAFFTISPPEVDFGGIVNGSDAAKTGLSASVILSNVGAQNLTFLGAAWTQSVDSSDGPVQYTNITNGALGSAFSSSSLPNAGYILATGQTLSVPLTFLPTQTGAYSTFVQWWTTGGTEYVLLTGSSSTAPIANISVSTIEGGWDYSEPVTMDFGSVLAGTTQSRDIRICNSGGSALLITKSKPPIDTELLAPNAGVDLHEGQTIDVNSCALGQVSIIAAPLGVNRLDHTVSDVWILNVDDITFGVHDVAITANIVTRQVGPLLSNGSSEYLYLGCYFDGGGRQLQKEFNSATNENGQCQTTCFNAGYMFAGTEYHTECWCGNNAPSASKYSAESLKECSFSCPGDVTQACGGPATYISIFYDRTKYTPGLPNTSNSLSSQPSSIPTLAINSTATLISSSSISSPAAPSNPGSTVKPPLTSISGTSTSTSSGAAESQIGPSNTQQIGSYSYVGCYTEGNGVRALGDKVYANNNMTIEICYATCQGYTWFGLEFHQECYCGNTLGAGSVPATESSCIDTCMANPLELCGGANRLSMYKNVAEESSSSPSSAPSSVASSSSILQTPTPNQSPSSNSISSLKNTVSSVSTSLGSAAASSTTLSTTVSAIRGFASVGCFSDPAGGPFGGHNMPKLFSNDSMTPDLCISSAIARLSATPATTYRFAGLEYGHECYAQTAAPSPEPTSLVGNQACTIPCKGDPKQSCGAGNMYNLYAATSVTVTQTGTWASVPATSTVGV
ncbi:hypothetical protein G7Y89_g7678 [Cudoniella acicularis]|uniref:WSC domain-containing protein n=1 Tax=Cudoniella acicularis TaxID=354080 RepID=A0A8H4W4B7_9HELO|nr:hypothetical protein G7Y89_g7678 [Cudoniella acicularis]